MKTNILLLVSLLLSHLIAFAQETEALGIHNYFSEGDTVVLSNKGYIRAESSQNSKVIDQLPVGYTMYISEPLEDEWENGAVIHNLKAVYYPVRYEKQGQWKSGYVWGGLIAQAHSVDKNGNRYIFGLRSFNEVNNEVTVAVMYIDGNTQGIHEQLFSYSFGYQTGYESKVIGNMGLSNLNQLFRVGFLGEACGIYTTYHYYGWNGEQFIELPSKNSVGDAGIFYYSENMLFPNEHKIGKNLIIIESVMSTMEYVSYPEIEGEVFEVEEIQKDRKIYLWDGKTARLLQPVKEEY